MIECEGTVRDRPAVVSFVDGSLSGDPHVCNIIRANVLARVDVCIPGVVGGPASLSDDVIALATILDVFDSIKRLNVDVEFGVLPPGAVA